jgi:rod shape-determining protein MreD
MLWFGFALIAFGAAFVGWLAYSILNLRLLSPDPALMQALMTVVLFPPFGWMFMRIHRAFLQH